MLASLIITLAVSLLPLLPEKDFVCANTFTDENIPVMERAEAEIAQPDTTDTTSSKFFETLSPAELQRFYTVTGAPRAIESPAPARRQPVIGLSNNILYDFPVIPKYGLPALPNIGIEYYPAKGHWTFGADIDFSQWRHYTEHRYNQIHNLTLSTRRYFKSTGTISDAKNEVSSFYGLYLLGNVNVAQYGIGWNAKGWEGEGLGVSLGIGYKWPLGRYMYLDLGVAAGYFYSRYDPYVWGNDVTGWYYYDYNGDPRDFVKRRMVLSWFGPTRAYISIGINLFDRNKSKR